MPERNTYEGAHSRAQAALANNNIFGGGGSMSSVNGRQQQQRMRGRIHASNDVLNGVSGMEHLSNSLNNRRTAANESPAILAQMRSGGHPYAGSVPEKSLGSPALGVGAPKLQTS